VDNLTARVEATDLLEAMGIPEQDRMGYWPWYRPIPLTADEEAALARLREGAR
jgi:hypothetical protein